MRKYQSEVAESVLREFVQLDRLDQLQREPAKKRIHDDFVDPARFGDCFEEIYRSDQGALPINGHILVGVPPVCVADVARALRKMKNGRCADGASVVAEMLKYANRRLLHHISDLLNGMIVAGTFPEDWYVTCFAMLPKLVTFRYRPIGARLRY